MYIYIYKYTETHTFMCNRYNAGVLYKRKKLFAFFFVGIYLIFYELTNNPSPNYSTTPAL